MRVTTNIDDQSIRPFLAAILIKNRLVEINNLKTMSKISDLRLWVKEY